MDINSIKSYLEKDFEANFDNLQVSFELYDDMTEKLVEHLGYYHLLGHNKALCYLELDTSSYNLETEEGYALNLHLFIKDDNDIPFQMRLIKNLDTNLSKYCEENKIKRQKINHYKEDSEQGINRYKLEIAFHDLLLEVDNSLFTQNVFNIHGNVSNSVVGSHNSITINIENIKKEIEEKGGEDKEELLAMLEQIEKTDVYKTSCFLQFSELLNKHSWITSPIATLLMMQLFS